MGSHSTQAIGISLFLLSFVALGGAFASASIALFVTFLILFGVAAAVMLKCKSMEGAVE
jgi:hypothetical protein